MPRFHKPQFVLQLVGAGVFCAVLVIANATADAQQPAPAPNGGLPPTFRPNPPVPEQIEDEKITEEEYVALKKKAADYQKALQSTNLKAAYAGKTTEEWITEIARIRVGRLSQKSNRNNLPAIRAEVTRELMLNLSAQPVRDFYIAEIVKNCDTLLDGNIMVRMQALKLLGELNSVKAGTSSRGPPAIAAHTGLPVLQRVIQAPLAKQPEALKIFAARAITRILQKGRVPKDKTRDQLALLLIAEIKNQRHPFVERELVKALVETELATINNGMGNQALIVYTLTQLVLDENRPYSIRCTAAEHLGRAPMPSGINGALLAYATARLAGQVATDYNAKKINHRDGVFKFQNLFFCIHGRAKQATTDGKSKSGLVNTSKHADINSLHAKYIMPMGSSIYQFVQKNGTPPPGLSSTAAAAMLNWPKPDMTLQAGLPPLVNAVPRKAKNSNPAKVTPAPVKPMP